MSVLKSGTDFAKQIEMQSAAMEEPGYLVALRAKAAEHYEQLPVPWYEKSNLAQRKLDAYTVAALVSDRQEWKTIAEPFMSDDALTSPLLVLADGELVFSQGIESLSAQGAIFTTLREAATTYSDIVEKHLYSVVPQDENQMIALHGALWRNGTFIYLPRHVVIDHPLQMISVTTSGGHGTFIHNLIVAEAGSQVEFVDIYVANQDIADELQVGVTEVVVQDGARVKIGTLEDFPRNSTNVLVRRAKVYRDAQMDWVTGEVSEGYTVAEFGSLLEGQGSRSTSHAIALGAKQAHFDLTSKMVHIAKFSDSDTTARGVMQDSAEAIYRGLTHILKGASGSNGQQSEKLLMLSRESHANAIPMLLIDENDVKCGHAASVGQINEEQLFYLMSRGISETDAKRMVVWGFIDPVLAKLPIDMVRKAVETVLERKMA
ncbi:Fe-S cluster assembly protein SufD [Sulfoacidibacillus ferrooxidans]|uniref:Fe-S cluster assembly protein SufD n=1 Tax=Sulfoacidibacillus ferrooxidans TaxID=2005001 RepID=A0A9X2ABK3_9BACL|nr:hypothetical protein [Sulfoacidibacillus ferrooxidans]